MVDVTPPTNMALRDAVAMAMADALKSRWVYVSDDLNNCLVDGGLFDLCDVADAAITTVIAAATSPEAVERAFIAVDRDIAKGDIRKIITAAFLADKGE